MASEQLGLTESVSMALGGMIGGGIYAVLGVVTGITGPVTWVSFALAGVVAACAGYSYNALNDVDDDNQGGSVSFVQSFVGNSTLAGMAGWTLLFGYVGSMAMYAFAFGEFTVALEGVPDSVGAVPLRPVVSVAAVAGFVGLNLLGAQATGSAENVLVAAKVGVLVAFGLGGLVSVTTGASGATLSLGLSRITSFGPVVAAAVSFVAFQGWQLLFYDQESIENPVETIRTAVYVSIPVAVAIYALVALVTIALAPEALRSHPHTALADAAGAITAPFGLRGAGVLVISLSALFSTGSAINATLFSTGHFAKGMLSDDLLPDRIGDSQAEGIPTRTLLVLGGVTAAFAAIGSLGGITSFASVAFIVVFGAMSYLAFRERDRDRVNPLAPAVGLVGTAGFLPLLFWHLYTNQRHTFYVVVAISVLVVAVELLYFERDAIEEEVESVEPDIV
ncbi:cationic amino acid transporter [Halosimplex carlsbadense 2-9-1]|uniref:Cationic amino acid transporter n=1 Tax=Halosimplex carlsbadense 2-9-1 TaxID=797114 RepID=M0CCE0_9EURY|nr:APC family permease [Halosimplex carlsbadense]ELZ20313.1 cationic amino acid transporter [Halosimplex carlsbadense 2-9-1]